MPAHTHARAFLTGQTSNRHQQVERKARRTGSVHGLSRGEPARERADDKSMSHRPPSLIFRSDELGWGVTRSSLGHLCERVLSPRTQQASGAVP